MQRPEDTGPSVGRRLYTGWLRVVARFGEVQTLILLTLVYSFVIGPMAVGAAAARRDLLAKGGLREGDSAWGDADTTTSPDLERARRLF